MPCTKPVKVKTPTGAETELVPEKVWLLASPKTRTGIKVGLFKDPSTGKNFRARVPLDYDCF